MEISSPSVGIFYISKMLALAPYKLRFNAKGSMEVRRSIFFTVYTISLITIMIFLTYRGLLFDANSKIPVRMKSATSKVVTALDVSVVVLATAAGAGCGLLGLQATRELNERLRKIDDTQHSFANYKLDRLRAILMSSIPLTIIAFLLGLDIWTWIRFAECMNKTAREDALSTAPPLIAVLELTTEIPEDLIAESELNVQWYIPFYSLYFILTVLHINFANTAFGIQRRFSRLNAMLRSSFLRERSLTTTASTVKITNVKAAMPTSITLSGTLNKTTLEAFQNESSEKHKGLLLRLLAENHESLGKCVTLISDSYGITVLFILVSCLLHLVATAYFLFLEMLSKKSDQYLWLQILWIAFHSFRLLMVVEPCHRSTRESRRTIQIVCEIERKVHDPILMEQVKKFWQQLLAIEVEFSASGLCKVNRNILTSFSSAIATYLVILIQFQKTNG